MFLFTNACIYVKNEFFAQIEKCSGFSCKALITIS